MENSVKKINVRFKLLDNAATMPTYAHDGDIGMDMKAISVEYDELNDVYIYHTGIAFETDYNIGAFLFPRSSIYKVNAYLTNSVGVVDSAIYRGEIIFCYKTTVSTYERANMVGIKSYMEAKLKGLSEEEAYKEYEKTKMNIYEMTKILEFAPYKVGDKIGQLVVFERNEIVPSLVDILSSSVRGANGFGSTDVK